MLRSFVCVCWNGPLLWQHPHRFIYVTYCFVRFHCLSLFVWMFRWISSFFGKRPYTSTEIDTHNRKIFRIFVHFYSRFIHAIFHFTFRFVTYFFLLSIRDIEWDGMLFMRFWQFYSIELFDDVNYQTIISSFLWYLIVFVSKHIPISQMPYY